MFDELHPAPPRSASQTVTRRAFVRSAVLAAGGLGIYATTHARHELEIVRRTLPIRNLPDSFQGFRIVQLSDIHLVLHSYAGVLAGPVAERAAGRLASVTYLAAFIAAPGQSLLDAEPPEVGQRYRDLAASDGGGWRVPASPAFLDQWGVTDPVLRDQVGPRLTDFPLRCLTDPVHFDPEPLAKTRKVYVSHTRPPLPGLRKSAGLAAAAGWETHQLPFGHDLMLAAPRETAELLAGIARGPAHGPRTAGRP